MVDLVDDDLSLEGRKLISAERERLTDLLTRRLFSEVRLL